MRQLLVSRSEVQRPEGLKVEGLGLELMRFDRRGL
jgi:hypothetical protein